ncbi:MAG: hypothetical protein HYX68_21175 [Planctomycetes bacterium]|jgi:hypothetical protein|nr:hypothetical protein [Planctomycetota bacterium]
MNLYTIILVDGTAVEVNGESIEDAIRQTQAKFGKAVANVSLEKEIKEEPSSTYESLRKGGPNF